MRSLHLAIRNINSLRGDHSVDFSDPMLAGVDLFGITGPTGSGKSTLLDAITLALYGRVVRHGAGNKPDASVSTHSLDASAAYRFSVDGEVYEARWSLRRKRGKLDADFQDPQRELLRLSPTGSAESVAEGAGRVVSAVEELLGLGFEQFQRVVLLPQGEFDKFLSGGESERAGILEKLTGTGRYQQYGFRINEKWNASNQALSETRKWMEGVAATLLADDQRSQMEAELSGLRSSSEQMAEQARILGERHRQAESLKAALLGCASAQQLLDGLSAAAREAEALEARVRRWREWEPAYRSQELWEVSTRDCVAARGRLESARQEVEMARLRWGRLRHQALASGRRRSTGVLESARLVAERLGLGPVSDLPSAVAFAQTHGDGLRRVHAALVRHHENRRHVEEAAESYWKAVRAASGSPARLSPWETVPPDGDERRRWFDESLSWASSRVAESETSAQQSEQIARLAEVAAAGAQTIADLRRQLESGGRCVVCGSDVRAGEVGSVEDSESRVRADAEAADQAWRAALNRVGEIRKWLSVVENRHSAWVASSGEASKSSAALESAWSETGMAAGILSGMDPEVLEDSLTVLNRVSLWAGEGALLRSLEDDPVPGGFSGDGPDRDWGDVESSLAEVRTAKSAWAQASNGLASASAAVDLAERGLTQAESARAQAWALAGIGEVFELEAARVDAAEAEAVELAARTRVERRIEAEARLAERSRTRDDLRSVVPALPEDDAGRSELGIAAISAESAAREASVRVVELSSRLRDDAQNRQRLVDRQREVDALALQESRWRFLRDHFGRERLTRRVQEMTMGALVGYANIRLAGFSGRYELVCDSAKPLEIRVRDRARLDALRPTAGLSGGEKFLVSLSLALGLSDIASRTSRIESLFIDEGFGTLDSETLETAMAALQQLRSESGRQVGIISHVGTLQERLSARIRLVPRGDGNSVVCLEG